MKIAVYLTPAQARALAVMDPEHDLDPRSPEAQKRHDEALAKAAKAAQKALDALQMRVSEAENLLRRLNEED